MHRAEEFICNIHPINNTDDILKKVADHNHEMNWRVSVWGKMIHEKG
jgi:hypothetical protein